MKKLLAIFVVFIISAALGLMWRLGVWRDVVVSVIDQHEQHLVYLDHLGAYHKMNDTILRVESELARNSFNCSLTFGHYLDSPEHQDEDRLRSQGGCLVPVARTGISAGSELKAGILPSGRYVHAEFDGSPAISPWKVYPKIKALADEKRLRIADDFYEVYEIQGERVKTKYLFKVLD